MLLRKSLIDRHKGVMYVISGIEFNKYDEALGEILAQLEAVKKGEISPEELDGAKKYVSSSLKSALDSASSLDSFYLSQAVEGLDYGIEEFTALVEKVNREDVEKIARSILLDTVYFLRNKREVPQE